MKHLHGLNFVDTKNISNKLEHHNNLVDGMVPVLSLEWLQAEAIVGHATQFFLQDMQDDFKCGNEDCELHTYARHHHAQTPANSKGVVGGFTSS